jgi:hypothetical protein
MRILDKYKDLEYVIEEGKEEEHKYVTYLEYAQELLS